MKNARHISVIAFAGLSLVLFAGCGSKAADSTGSGAEARPAKIITVGTSGRGVRTYPGRVQAAKRASLSFRVGGPVVEIRVGKGQRVASGDILARIDPRDYQVQVANLEAQLAAARAQEVQAAEGYQRVRGLFEHDNASKADFDNAKAALDVGKAQVEATEQALRAARLSLADTQLKAPYDGTVADRLVEEHQTVAAGQPIIQFQGNDGMEVLIHVPEREVGELTRKAPAGIEVRFDALSNGDSIPAQVKEFATETDRQTQTFPVTLELGGMLSDDLMPGMTASVDWITGNGEHDSSSMVVPLAAVGSDPDNGPFVWRVDAESMTVEMVAVTTGALTDSGIEITGGIEADDRILAAGVDFVVEGMKVRPLGSEKD